MTSSTSRSVASILRGAGSILDLGGTTYKRTPVRVARRRDGRAADRQAISRDITVAVGKTAKMSRTAARASQAGAKISRTAARG